MISDPSDVEEAIRGVIDTHGHLPMQASKLSDNDDLYDLGLTSHASVNVMLALEDEFEIEFPDSLLRRSTFESIASIREALSSMDAEQ